MTTTFAKRTRPFTSPHNIKSLVAEAKKTRKDFMAQRKETIADLVKNNPSEPDEFYWTMVYDLEHAPSTTGRAQLLEFGIVPTPPQDLEFLSDIHDELWTIIEALSKCGIQLLNTDHLTDADLYARLYYRILDEHCKMMPTPSTCIEYIDVLHPMDLDYPLGKAMLDRGPAILADKPYERAPIFSIKGELANRDMYLPTQSL